MKSGADTAERPRVRRGFLTLELVLVLPIILLVLLAVVQYSILLLSTHALSVAAHVGVREAALPSSNTASVEAAVDDALDGWSFRNAASFDVQIFVNDVMANPATAMTDDKVEVLVLVDATDAAPNLLNFIGLSLVGQDIQAEHVMRKE